MLSIRAFGRREMGINPSLHILSTGVIASTWNPALITLAVASQRRIRLMLIFTIAPGTNNKINDEFIAGLNKHKF